MSAGNSEEPRKKWWNNFSPDTTTGKDMLIGLALWIIFTIVAMVVLQLVFGTISPNNGDETRIESNLW